MEEIEQRLRQNSETCLNNFSLWHKNKKDVAAREALQDAIHELRKVASRLEIEMAISERDEMAQKRIPIPPHRDSKRRPGHENMDEAEPGNEGESDFNAGGRGPGGMRDMGLRPGGDHHRRRMQHHPRRTGQGGNDQA